MKDRFHTIISRLSRLRSRVKIPGWLRTVSGTIVFIVVFGYLIYQISQTFTQLRQAWQPVSWLYLVLALAWWVLCLLLMAVLWYGILRTMGAKIPLSAAIRIYAASLLPQYVPGLVWGYVGRTVLCERQGIALRTAAGSSVIEVGLVVGSGLIIIASRYLPAVWYVPLLLIVIGAIILSGIQLGRRRGAQDWVKRLTTVGVWYGWGIAYVGFWLLYGMANGLVALAVIPHPTLHSIIDIVTYSAVAWLAGFIVILVPSGLGIREGAFAFFLTPIVGPAKAAFIPLAARGIGITAEIILFFSTSYLFPTRIRSPETGLPKRSIDFKG